MERGRGLMCSVVYGLDGVKRLLVTKEDNFGANIWSEQPENTIGRSWLKDVSMTEEDTFLWQSMEGEGDGDLSLFLRERILQGG